MEEMFTASSWAMGSQCRLLSKGEVISSWRWPLWRLNQKKQPSHEEPRKGTGLKWKNDKRRTQGGTGRRGRRGSLGRSVGMHCGVGRGQGFHGHLWPRCVGGQWGQCSAWAQGKNKWGSTLNWASHRVCGAQGTFSKGGASGTLRWDPRGHSDLGQRTRSNPSFT